MRGDRPASGTRPDLRRRASPHARGSTRAANSKRLVGLGFPACAGIDPPPSIARCGGWRLPRMRGDRPCWRRRRHDYCRASPHARGSTLNSAQCGANAGGLPRMRGDRPKMVGWLFVLLMASPHARGSTRSVTVDSTGLRGFPACAGIDLDAHSASTPATWLPRMRGDRPPRPSE